MNYGADNHAIDLPVVRRSSLSRSIDLPMALDPLNSTRRHGLLLNSTCDIRLRDIRHGGKNYSDMRHGYFLNSTCDMLENKRQRLATLPFFKLTCDIGIPLPSIKGPLSGLIVGRTFHESNELILKFTGVRRYLVPGSSLHAELCCCLS